MTRIVSVELFGFGFTDRGRTENVIYHTPCAALAARLLLLKETTPSINLPHVAPLTRSVQTTLSLSNYVSHFASCFLKQPKLKKTSQSYWSIHGRSWANTGVSG